MYHRVVTRRLATLLALLAGCGGGGAVERPDAGGPPPDLLDLSFEGLSGLGELSLTTSSGYQPGVTPPRTLQIPAGDTVTMSWSPREGYHFAGVSANVHQDGMTGTLTMTRTQTITFRFLPIEQNLIFVSSENVTADLGGVEAYDAVCERLVIRARITHEPGEVMAWLSTSTRSAGERVGLHRGFVRMDGRPVADLLWSPDIRHAVELDETARPVGSREVFTGTEFDGTAGGTCADWTSSASTLSAKVGDAHGGPTRWTAASNGQCSFPLPIYCLLLRSEVPFEPPRDFGKIVFVSRGSFPVTSGLAAADALCDSERPGGGPHNPFRALLPDGTAPASRRLNFEWRYIRPDGTFLGMGGDLALGQTWSGIWQTSDAYYVTADYPVATGGGRSPDEPVDLGFTCGDWRDPLKVVSVGSTGSTLLWWSASSTDCATRPMRVYCVEQ